MGNRGIVTPTLNDNLSNQLITKESFNDNLGILNPYVPNEVLSNLFSGPIKASDINSFFSSIESSILADYNNWGNATNGDLSTSGNVNLCDNTVDGDTCVLQYNNLTVNDGHILTTAVRRRGLIIYVSGDLTVNGTISMTARGAVGDPLNFGVDPAGLNIARFVPNGIETGSSLMSGTGNSASGIESNQKAVSHSGKIFNFPIVGAAGGARFSGAPGYNPGINGIDGQTGGGASGYHYSNNGTGYSGAGSAGTLFSGGSGGGANFNDSAGNSTDALPFGGAGGNGGGNHPWMGGNSGAGNPTGVPGACGNRGCPVTGEDGTGGLLMIFVRGNINFGANGKIEANGSAGGQRIDSMTGGGSGGGSVLVLHGGNIIPINDISSHITASGGGGIPAGNGSVRIEKILK